MDLLILETVTKMENQKPTLNEVRFRMALELLAVGYSRNMTAYQMSAMAKQALEGAEEEDLKEN